MTTTTKQARGFSARHLCLTVITVLTLAGCHGHLKHIDGPGHSEDAPGQQKKH